MELVDELSSLGLSLQVHDPFCPKQTAQSADIELSDLEDMNALDLMIVASPHRVYRSDPAFLTRLRPNGALMDIRGAFRGRPELDQFRYWAL